MYIDNKNTENYLNFFELSHDMYEKTLLWVLFHLRDTVHLGHTDQSGFTSSPQLGQRGTIGRGTEGLATGAGAGVGTEETPPRFLSMTIESATFRGAGDETPPWLLSMTTESVMFWVVLV